MTNHIFLCLNLTGVGLARHPQADSTAEHSQRAASTKTARDVTKVTRHISSKKQLICSQFLQKDPGWGSYESGSFKKLVQVLKVVTPSDMASPVSVKECLEICCSIQA